MGQHFRCSICGEEHEGLPTEWAYKLPDVVWAIPATERKDAAKFDSDLCEFDERFFIRGVLRVPFADQDGDFGWGVWAEVEESVFFRYLDLYEVDAEDEPPYAGALANKLPGVDHFEGHKLLVQFQSKSQRPAFLLKPDDESGLARDQRDGIDQVRLHDILSHLPVRTMPPEPNLWRRIRDYFRFRQRD